MLFNSFDFCFIFFPLVTALYFLLPHRFRWAMLLAASCWFYMAFVPVYILILGFTIAVDYAAGILIERSQGSVRKRWLIASIVANVGVLAFFKYFNFLNQSIAALVQGMGIAYAVPDLGILLPIGLSFHTFQSLSYTIEVYRGHQKAERRPGIFALYVMFYPQLVAGPIERPGNLLRQLNERHVWDHARVVHGLQQMLWGFFKKLVIADRCAVIVDQVYGDPSAYDGLGTLLATYLFALQIYCDFSGYTDIALGAARVMGFDLMVNFRTPYRSASISEFWSRWHISLSSWFRDYVYIPLGGNRVVRWRWFMNLMIVFLLSGLWHGANWTYVAWGGLHGLYLVLAIVVAGAMVWFDGITGLVRQPRLRRALAILVTLHLVVFGWVFFRADNFAEAGEVITSWTRIDGSMRGLIALAREIGAGIVATTLAFALVFIALDPWADAIAKGERSIAWRPARFAYFGALLAACLIFGNYGAAMFIYFQF
ncbi:MAG: MBOAT family protein [Flavobacteriales bacterium]|nr:MBOAT family protein [Flavobacteriales bacterium]